MICTWHKWQMNRPVGKNILDLLFSSSPDLIQNVEVSPSISDHCSVLADVLLKARMTKKPVCKIFMFTKDNATKLQGEISSFWDTSITTAPSRDTNENWNFLTNGLMEIIHKLVPQKGTRQRHDLPWLDHQLRTKINRKNKYHHRAKKAKPAFKKQWWKVYKHQQSTIQKEIKTAYNNYINSPFEDQVGQKQSKRFWKTI